MPKFEAHITCLNVQSDIIQKIGQEQNWKYSCIHGDALLEQKPYCYLTAYRSDETALYNDMKAVVQELQHNGVGVLREKIERIIFDTKTGVDEL